MLPDGESSILALAEYDPARHVPEQKPHKGYVGSDSCRDCHQHNHATWHDSYHRTMTQLPAEDTVIGDFDDAWFRNHAGGQDFRMHHSSNRFWITVSAQPTVDGLQPDGVTWPVALLTGSHHMQGYWIPVGSARTLSFAPIMYLKPEGKWVPRSSVFLHPPPGKHDFETGRWNKTCIECHATAGVTPKTQRVGEFETRVAEFGISCEACHGPGEVHIRRQVALKEGSSDLPPESIVNPVDLPPARSSQVCGACHGRRWTRFGKEQLEYRPGDDLNTKYILFRGSSEVRAELQKHIRPDGSVASVDEHLGTYLWNDGHSRVSGAEFNGLLETPCYQQGELTCFSCHRMHQSKNDPRPRSLWADDQLRHDRKTTTACTQCHDAASYAAESHTHHAKDSSGSSCYNCHMPHTSYGLLKAIRAHVVSSPNVATNLATTRPNACNVCHLDKSLGWTARHLQEWYDIAPPKLNDDQQRISATVLDVLQGDAGLRALAAWRLGWEPAVSASGSDWLAPHLAELMTDPYDAVRCLAGRSLKKTPGFEDVAYDFVGEPSEWQTAAAEVRARWLKTAHKSRPELLVNENGQIESAERDRLLQVRDQREVVLNE